MSKIATKTRLGDGCKCLWRKQSDLKLRHAARSALGDAHEPACRERRLVLEAQVPQPTGRAERAGHGAGWVNCGRMSHARAWGGDWAKGGIAVSRGVYVVNGRGARCGRSGPPLCPSSGFFAKGARVYQIQSCGRKDARGGICRLVRC